MNFKTKENTALLVIDMQKGFDDPKWGIRNNLQAESNIAQIIELWRAKSRPVIHIQHCSTEADSPLRLGQSGVEFKPEAEPHVGEVIFQKSVNSAFIGTSLESHLKNEGIHQLVITGLTTDHCVSTTTRMAGNLGFDVLLVSDATATFNRKGVDGKEHSAEEIFEIHLASLNDEFCQVVTAQSLLSS